MRTKLIYETVFLISYKEEKQVKYYKISAKTNYQKLYRKRGLVRQTRIRLKKE